MSPESAAIDFMRRTTASRCECVRTCDISDNRIFATLASSLFSISCCNCHLAYRSSSFDGVRLSSGFSKTDVSRSSTSMSWSMQIRSAPSGSYALVSTSSSFSVSGEALHLNCLGALAPSSSFLLLKNRSANCFLSLSFLFLLEFLPIFLSYR